VTSNGFTGSRRATSFTLDADVSVKDTDGRRPEGSYSASTRFRADLPDIAVIGREAGERALANLGAKPGPSAVLPMVVENRVAARMVRLLLGPLQGASLQQKQSFLANRVGQRVGSDHLSFTDDPFIRRGLASRTFDMEGLAARQLPVFEGGVLRSYYVDSYYGRKLGVAPTTGNPSNLSWRLGTRNADALIADIKDGILVTGFIGGNSNGLTGDFSLGVSGFRIRQGKRAERLSESNISGSQLDVWKRLVAVGNDPHVHSAMRMPTLVFDGIQFAGV
jgi:PmbA protein